MSDGNAHLFKQSADGTWKPYLRDGGRFVENVDLIAIPPDFAKVFADISTSTTLAAITAKLDAIKISVENLTRQHAEVERGNVQGAIIALDGAGSYRDPEERRHHMLARSGDLTQAIGGLIGLLNAHLQAMPRHPTGVFDGIWKSGVDDARRAYSEVAIDIDLVTMALLKLLNALQELGEYDSAATQLGLFRSWFKTIDLALASERSRLVPAPQGSIPAEVRLRGFQAAIAAISEHMSPSNGGMLSVEFDVAEVAA